MDTPLPVIYAALLALFFVGLSVRTLRMRRRYQIEVGDAGNAEMLRAMRVHANFPEYAPLTLLLVFFLEAVGTPAFVAHLLCIFLLLGRLSHAWGSTPRGWRSEKTRWAVFSGARGRG